MCLGISYIWWIIVIALPFSISFGEALPRKRVCVIGAGLAGLVATKQLSDFTDELEPLAFEKNSDVGGLWIYTNETGLDEHGLLVHSRVYKNMRTTVPRKTMAVPDYQKFHGRENRSFVSHEMVLEYLRNYTDHFDLRRYIQFDALVTKVSPIESNGDWRLTKWRIDTRNLDTNEYSEVICNAVMVCNGHHFESNVPIIPGIESFPGRVLHSLAYRMPDSFANRTVVVLGAGTSGQEIAVELSHHAETVYLSHRHDKIQKKFPSNVLQVKGVVAANGSQLILQDNSTMSADDLMYCTGYLHDIPFLDQSSDIIVEKKLVRPLYKLAVNIEHPSMALVGLPAGAAYRLTTYVQSKYFVALLRGKVRLPSYEEMKSSEATSLFLGPAQWNYYDDLASDVGFEKVPLFYKRANLATRGLTDHFLDYQDFDFAVLNDDEVLIRRQRDGKMGTGWEDFID